MNRRKEIINEYKERKLYGGVYKITNTLGSPSCRILVANSQKEVYKRLRLC